MDLCYVGPFISDMQLKVFVTKLVKLNVFVFYVNLHHIQVLALALTWMKCYRFNWMESVSKLSLRVKRAVRPPTGWTEPSGQKSYTATQWVNWAFGTKKSSGYPLGELSLRASLRAT